MRTRIFLISLFSLAVAACALSPTNALPAVVTATSAPTTSGPAAATDALPSTTTDAPATDAPVKIDAPSATALPAPTLPPVSTETSSNATPPPNATLSPSPTLAPIVFSGKGAQAAGPFSLDGLALFKFEHAGAGIYSVQMLDATGKLVSILFSGVGKATVSTAQGAEAGLYVANVNADGKWTLSVERLSP